MEILQITYVHGYGGGGESSGTTFQDLVFAPRQEQKILYFILGMNIFMTILDCS